MKAQIITIGDEILIGQIIDTNSAWLGAELQLLGIELKEIRSISDDLESIESAIEQAFQHFDLILMTGGLGPTKDDMTKTAIASYFEVGMTFHEPTWQRIERLFEKWGRSTTKAHREQCFMPDNAEILFNKMGSAPGMLFRKGNKVLVSMPGVPHEMKWIFEHQLKPILIPMVPNIAIAHRTILTVGEGESRIAERVADLEESLSENMKLAFLPSLGSVRLRLTALGNDQATVDQQVEQKKAEFVARIPELIYGYEKENLAVKVGELLMEKEQTVGLAESCTGGHLAHQFTKNSGSSAYFLGGIVAYSDDVKMNQLGVSETTLKAHGAVSEQTVREMVKGTLKELETDYAIAVSGIAGPGGGSKEKPVGTIWLAVGNNQGIKTHLLQLSKDRLLNIQYTSVSALNLLRKFLLEAE